MMRSALIFGLIAAYVACAFVPPTEQNVMAQAAQARTIIEGTAKGALQGQIVDSKQLAAAATLLKQIASDPKVTELVEQTAKKSGSAVTAGALSSAANALTSVVPSSASVLKKASRVVYHPVVARSSEWKNVLFSEKDKHLKDLYESVDWAQRKADVRLCKDLDPTLQSSAPNGPTMGDLLALCIAKVTGEPERCKQIDALTAPVLKSVCETELEGRA